MENLQKKPAKGILKTSSSFDQQEAQQKSHSDIKWDEMNILQTLHPPDKDYGLMKIEEPKTPYSYYKDGEGASDTDEGATASSIISTLSECINKTPKILMPEADEEEEEAEEELTEEELKKKREFEIKRKHHYNEYQAVKLARKLLEEEDEDEDDDDTKDTMKEEDSNEEMLDEDVNDEDVEIDLNQT